MFPEPPSDSSQLPVNSALGAPTSSLDPAGIHIHMRDTQTQNFKYF